VKRAPLAVVAILALAIAAAVATSSRGAKSGAHYATARYGGDAHQVLEVLRPARRGTSRPAVLFIHGGGWNSGSRAEWRFAEQKIAAKGWVAFSIDYRLEPPAEFPAPIDDSLAAVRWVHDHAKTYGVDPKRIAVVGDSAGAHLALLVATKGADDPATRVAAAVSWSGPTNMTTIVQTARPALVDNVVGFLACVVSKCTDDRYVQASPVNFVGASTPPVLLVSSTAEQIPLSQATEMKAKLVAAHVPVSLVVYKGSRHALEYQKDAWAPTLTFLTRYLAKR
jgi:acetyl esterase/lipase